MRRVAVVLGLSFALACGPGKDTTFTDSAASDTSTASPTTGNATEGTGETDPSSSTNSSSTGGDEAESESSGTETGLPCIAGLVDCECLPDGSCGTHEGYALGCGWGNTCQGCGFEPGSALSDPCVEGECPSDCSFDLTTLTGAPIQASSYPYTEITWQGAKVPLVGSDCATEDGWNWVELGVMLEFCGSYCDAWMNPPEPISYDIEVGCPPG